MSELWNATFENGRLDHLKTGVDVVICDSGTIEVAAAAAYSGSYGCKITPVQGYRTCIAMHRGGLTKFRQRFYLDPNGISIPSGSYFTICRNQHYDDSWLIYVLRLGYTSPNYWLQQGMVANSTYGDDLNAGSTYNITDGWNRIEQYWQQGSPGSIQLWIDGVSKETLSYTNSNHVINKPCIGGAWNPTVALSGSFYVDDWKANNDGSEIGA